MIDFARLEFRREKCVMLKYALETPIFLDRSRHFGAANQRPREADRGHVYLVETVRDADRLQERASDQDGRQMRLCTPTIRRDRPTVQGSPALLSRPMFAGQVPADPPAKNHPV